VKQKLGVSDMLFMSCSSHTHAKFLKILKRKVTINKKKLSGTAKGEDIQSVMVISRVNSG